MFTVLPYAQVFLGLIDHLLTGATWKKNEIVITDCISLGNLVGNIVGILLGVEIQHELQGLNFLSLGTVPELSMLLCC